ncbi:hypothetical protein FRC09_001386, partial [Ceratobasidium sp. 395]
MWNFESVCTHLKPLAERVLDHADKIVFAREFGLTDWLAPAHARLCLRQENLTSEEAGKLGLESVFFIFKCREAHQLGNRCKTAHCPTCGNSTCRNCRSFMVPAIPAPSEQKILEEARAWVDKGCG